MQPTFENYDWNPSYYEPMQNEEHHNVTYDNNAMHPPVKYSNSVANYGTSVPNTWSQTPNVTSMESNNYQNFETQQAMYHCTYPISYQTQFNSAQHHASNRTDGMYPVNNTDAHQYHGNNMYNLYPPQYMINSSVPQVGYNPHLENPQQVPLNSTLPIVASNQNNHNLAEVRKCANCETTSTPLWRRKERTENYLCNACGIFYKTHHYDRPLSKNLKVVKNQKNGWQCTQCSTQVTTLWRRGANGEKLCNACGLYERLRGTKRPLRLTKSTIQTRKRKLNQDISNTDSAQEEPPISRMRLHD